MNIVLFIAVALFLIGALYEGILRRRAEALLSDECEEKKKLAPLIEKISDAEEKLRLRLKEKERTAFVLYSSAFASILLLAL